MDFAKHTSATGLTVAGVSTVGIVGAGYALLRGTKNASLDRPATRAALRRVYAASGVTAAALAAPLVITHTFGSMALAPVTSVIFSSAKSAALYLAGVSSCAAAAYFLPPTVDLDDDDTSMSEEEAKAARGLNYVKIGAWGLATLGVGVLISPLGALSGSLLATAAGYSVGMSVASHATAYMAASTTGFLIAAPVTMTASVLAIHTVFETMRYPFVTLLLPTVASSGLIIVMDTAHILATVVDDPEHADAVQLSMRICGSTLLAFLRILYRAYQLARGAVRTGNKIADAVIS